jgi:RES domain-containing protein
VRAPLALESSQEVGRTWLETDATLALVVPSVVVSQEVNYVLNVSRPQFARVEISAPESFSFDQRLWRTRVA